MLLLSFFALFGVFCGLFSIFYLLFSLVVASAALCHSRFLTGGRSGQHHTHRDEPALERIEHQAEALERGFAQQRLIVWFAKDDRRGATLALEFKVGVSELPADGRAVRECEVDFAIGSNAEIPEQFGRHQALDRSRVDEEPHRRLAPCATALLYQEHLAGLTHNPRNLNANILLCQRSGM